MERIETGDPQRLTFREPIGWWIVFTVPFFGGLSVLQVGMLVHGLSYMHGPVEGWQLLIGLLLLAFAVKVVWGGISCHLRRELGVDGRARTATTAWGLLVPVFHTTHDLSGAIALRSALRVVDHGRYKEFFNELYAVTATHEIKLAVTKEGLAFRNLCEDVAAVLKLDLVEVRQGIVVVLRRGDEAGKNVLEANTPPALEGLLEAAPALDAVRLDAASRTLRVEMDAPGRLGVAILKLLGVLVLLGVGAVWLSGAPSSAGVAASIFGTLFYGLIYLIAQPEWATVEARPGALEVLRKGLVFSSRKAYPVAAIRTIKTEGRLLQIDTREGLETLFLKPMQPAEGQWLRGAMLAMLAPPRIP